MANIFISHSPKDNRAMLALREQLGRIGYRAWTDPEPRPGNDWRFAIDEAIRASDAVLIVMTATASDSVYVTYEWATALAWGITVIPVMFTPAKLHPRLETLTRFDVGSFKDPMHFWDYFLRELPRLVRPSAPVASTPARATGTLIDRSVMPPKSGHWLVMRRGATPNMMWQLTGQVVTIGRDNANAISIDDVGVSRFHCRLSLTGTGYAIEDLQSTNGVVVNGTRTTAPMLLPAGAVIQLGENITLTYEVVV
jgi:hypothetical protein